MRAWHVCIRGTAPSLPRAHGNMRLVRPIRLYVATCIHAKHVLECHAHTRRCQSRHPKSQLRHFDACCLRQKHS